MEFTYSAFWELSSSRPSGWSLGPIPWHVVEQYAVSHDLDEEERSDFHWLIRAMDASFLAYHEEESKKKSGNKKKSGKIGGR